MKPRRLFALIAATVLTLGISATALADGSVSWTGQGVTSGALNNVDCEASDTGFGLFIYTGDSDTAPVLSIDGTTYVGVQQGKGAWHFEVPLPDPLDPTQHTIFVTFTGSYAAGELTLSHGCPSETTTTTTTASETTTTTASETTTATTTATTTSEETTTTEATTTQATTTQATTTQATTTAATTSEETTTAATTSEETTSHETTSEATTSQETTPEGSVEELTPPHTDTASQPTGSSTVSTGLLLVLAGVLSGVLVLVPAAARRRR